MLKTTGNYSFDEYVSEARWSSYRLQVSAALFRPRSEVLLVGNGDGSVASLLKHWGRRTTVLDFDPRVACDVRATVESLPFGSRAFGTTLCCQVLEHLPSDRFDRAVEQLLFVTGERLVVSLPVLNQRLTLRLGTTGQPNRFSKVLNTPKLGTPGPEHHWELGSSNAPSQAEVSSCLSEHGEVTSFANPQNPYHQFFILDKTN